MIGVLTNGPITWASSRFRGWWYQEVAPDMFRVYGPDNLEIGGLADCDTIVFQKRQTPVDMQALLRFRAEGRKVVYDTTDPMHFWYPEQVKFMAENADCVVCSNRGLLDEMAERFRIAHSAVIPDRMLPAYHPTVAKHGERETVMLVWFGCIANRIALAGAIPVLEYLANMHDIKLRIIDDAPGLRMIEAEQRLSVEYVPWTLETFHAQMVACDIALYPPYPGAWGRMKSNNKAVTAGWCGLPVASGENIDELVALICVSDFRARRGAAGRQEAEGSYNIADSIKEWQELVESL